MGPFLQSIHGLVGGAIIDDNDLEVGERLGEDAVDSSSDEGPSVVHRQENGHGW